MSWTFWKDSPLKVSFALSVLIVGLFPLAAMGQTIVGDRIIYPPEFNPLIASRPRPPEVPLVPQAKFIRHENRIPGHYIVVLNDDVVKDDASLDVRQVLEARLAEITDIANRHARAYGGKVHFIYHAALKGYSIELPNEAAAIALSEDPEVKCVEEDAISELSGGPAIQTDQSRTIPIGSMTNAFCTHNPTRPDQKGSKLYFDPRRPR